MEKHLSEIYARSQKELEKKTQKFWADFERKDIVKKKKLDAGEITEAQYKQWRQGQLMTGKHWDEMTKSVAEEMLNADKTAAAYVNGKLPEIYSLNYNALADQTAGIKGYSFELVNADAVKHLATTDKSLLPYKKVNGENVVRWNTQKVNSEVLQGIIQGESVQKIAKRLSNVVGMEKNSAIRNARTTTTGAENRGRLDSYERAQKDGIILKKRWIATHDPRTREEHLELDDQIVDIDEPFQNSLGDIMYPGDPNADPANVYNCRCTMVSFVEGFVSPETGEIKELLTWEEQREEEKVNKEEYKSYADELLNKNYSPNIAEYRSVEDYWKAKAEWEGDRTKYVDDMYEYGKFTTATGWSGNNSNSIARIEGTVADLNDKYPVLPRGTYEYGTKIEHLTVCDYNRAWEYLPNGENDRRLTDEAAAQVFIINKENTSEAVIAFNRGTITETLDETIKNRQNAIENGRILSSIGYSPEVTTIHEWGHLMSEHLSNGMIYDDPTVKEYWEWYKSLSKNEIRKGLSDYATANRGEFEAECFAEIMMPNPRPIALKFKEYLDAVIEKGY